MLFLYIGFDITTYQYRRIYSLNIFSIRTSIFQKKHSPDFDAVQSLNIYIQNGKGKARCGKGWSDFFYIPSRLASQYRALDAMAYRNSLYLEISVTTILRCLDIEENFEKTGGVYLPDLNVGTDSKTFWNTYNRFIIHIHPFKMRADDFDELKFNQTVLEFKKDLCKL